MIHVTVKHTFLNFEEQAFGTAKARAASEGACPARARCLEDLDDEDRQELQEAMFRFEEYELVQRPQSSTGIIGNVYPQTPRRELEEASRQNEGQQDLRTHHVAKMPVCVPSATDHHFERQGGPSPMPVCKVPHVWSHNSVSTMASSGDYPLGDEGLEASDGSEHGSPVHSPAAPPLCLQPGLNCEYQRHELSLFPCADREPPYEQLAATAGSPLAGDGSPLDSAMRSPRRHGGRTGRGRTVSEGQADMTMAPWRPQTKEYRHAHVPKNINLAEEFMRSLQETTTVQMENTNPVMAMTTLMIRNIPNRYSQRELIRELEDLGFAGSFDFLYLPMDKGTMSNVGYAFVNFVDRAWAERCLKVFQNYRFQRHCKVSSKVAAVSYAHLQGLENNVRHYQNAAINSAKQKQRRPVIFANISGAVTGAERGSI